MWRSAFFALAFFFPFIGTAQKTIEKALERFNKGTVPYITVDELKEHTDFVLLDTRKKEEFEVSHLQNAVWVGYKKFDIGRIQSEIPNHSTPVIVYCSIGVRSEQIGEKLQKAGYTNVKNLYGGIFQWKDEGNVVVDSTNQTTERIHAFSKQWGKLLTNGDKVYSLKKESIEKQR